MKVKFTKSVTFTPLWNNNTALPDDEKVTVTVNVMSFADLMKLLDSMREFKADDGAPDASKLLVAAGDLLGRYATVHNLSDDEGPVDMQKLTKYSAFIGLAMEIMLKLSEVSTPSADDVGNSPKQ